MEAPAVDLQCQEDFPRGGTESVEETGESRLPTTALATSPCKNLSEKDAARCDVLCKVSPSEERSFSCANCCLKHTKGPRRQHARGSLNRILYG